MKIGIFGGAFNPPHIGHVEAVKAAVAKLASKSEQLDLLMIIPTGTPSHKSVPQASPPPDIRFLMTKNAFNEVENSFVSNIEVYSKEKNYTIDTVHSIIEDYTDARLFLFVGNDMYDSLDT